MYLFFENRHYHFANWYSVFVKKYTTLLLKFVIGYTGSIMVIFDAARYHFINQGCITADGIEDKEELVITDVRT